MTRKREQTFPSTGSDGPTSAQDMPTGPSPSSPPPTDSSPIPSFHPHAPAQAAQPKCKIIAVGGSSGGVGKSIFVANLGVYLSSIGRQTVVVDADASHGSLTALVGGPARPQIGWHATAVPNLSLLITGLDSKWHPSTPKVDISSLYLDLRNKGISHAIIDLGNVDGLDALDAFLDADGMIFITVPEPPALAHTYAFLSRAFLRHMLRKLEGEEHRLLIELANQFTTPPPPLDLWRILDEEGHPLADRIRDEMEHFRPMLVLNQTRLRADLEAGDALRTVIRRRLGLLIEYLGHIEHDDTVWSTVRARKLLLIESPGTKASKNIERIARRLLGIESGKISPFQRTVPAESHHDLLEVERGATDEELRRAYKRMREIFASDSLVTYSLFSPEELEHVRRRIDEAFSVLIDPSKRRPYELSIFPSSSDEESAPSQASVEDEPRPPPPEITPTTDFTGPLLKALRISAGMRLEDISKRTKIRIHYLEAIEEEQFERLPPPVYVRGFVFEIAKILKTDPLQAARTYVRRYREFLNSRGRLNTT